MSKRLVQTKLSFSSSQPDSLESTEPKLNLKRQLSNSDTSAETDMSGRNYASAVTRGRGNANRNPGHESKRSRQNETPAHHGSTSVDPEFQRPYCGSQTQEEPNFSDLSKSSSSRDDEGETRDRNTAASKGDPKNRSEEEGTSENTNQGSFVRTGVVPLRELKTAPDCFKKGLPQMKPTERHYIFFEPIRGEWREALYLKSYPSQFQEAWDDKYVYMPCSISNRVPSETKNGSEGRWDRIKVALKNVIQGVEELEAVILSYNCHYRRRWNFDALRSYFAELKEEDRDKFFTDILPKMQTLALQLPDLCTKRIPILKKYMNATLTMSQNQVACLLANAFFCTFPKRSFKYKGHRSDLPDINFSNLYSESKSDRKVEKLKCIMNYFKRVIQKMPSGTVSYTRQSIEDFESMNWHKCDQTLRNLHVSPKGTIEDDGKGMLQADFANKYVGGGVLGHGLVQEEIRFLLCPEMIISRLFTEVLQDKEVLVMTGCERFSSYTGYSDTFRYNGDYKDNTKRDEWGRLYTEVVAMDALVVRSHESQFDEDHLMRELNKAYCAFKRSEYRKNETDLPAVCTGNWGCGAFGGDKHLKALIQMMAASAAGRDVCYFTFGDSRFATQLESIHEFLTDGRFKIKDILDMIKDYKRKTFRSYYGEKKSLFEDIASSFGFPLPGVSEEPRTEYNEFNDSDVEMTGDEEYELKKNSP